MLERCNRVLFGMRGAAITLMKLDYKHKKVHYGNIGNVTFALGCADGQLIRPIPKRGFLSGKKVKWSTSVYPYNNRDTFIIYTDGAKCSNIDIRVLFKFSTLHEMVEYVTKEIQYEQDDTTFLIGQTKRIDE